jgi:hypothetical protein
MSQGFEAIYETSLGVGDYRVVEIYTGGNYYYYYFLFFSFHRFFLVLFLLNQW